MQAARSADGGASFTLSSPGTAEYSRSPGWNIAVQHLQTLLPSNTIL
jgi:hypothetical protein